jgi:lipid-A-disaccharide synthase
MSLRIGLVAGEPSGDLIAARVLQGLEQQVPDLKAEGIGGPALSACGMNILHPMHALSVFGYVDALKSLPRLISIFTDVKKHWLSHPPDVFVGVDAPDFNLRLEQKLRARGIPTVHFVGPSIWAWRYDRIHQIRQAVSHMLVLFPFEKAIYEREGIPVTYVGHPMADAIQMQVDPLLARARLGIEQDAPVVALLPGSRASEIRLMAPRFLQAAQKLSAREPRFQFVVPMVNETRYLEFMQHVAQYPVPNLHIVRSPPEGASAQGPVSWEVLAACDMALVTSGTATLETALFKRPMVISYVLSPWMRRLMAWKSGQDRPSLPWVGLPNVLNQSFVVPELLQEQATADQLADTFWDLWCDPARRALIAENFQAMHQSLRCQTAQKASQAILEVAKNR